VLISGAEVRLGLSVWHFDCGHATVRYHNAVRGVGYTRTEKVLHERHARAVPFKPTQLPNTLGCDTGDGLRSPNGLTEIALSENTPFIYWITSSAPFGRVDLAMMIRPRLGGKEPSNDANYRM
jgi:hypothetical protein